MCPRNLSAESVRPSVHSIVDAITTASFYKVSFLIVLSSPRKFRRASLLECAPETGSCCCQWTFGGKRGRKKRETERDRKGDRAEKGGGLSHQGRNTRTRWYGKPIIIVFTRQQRAAIKNCLFIQARLFSIRSHTSDGFPWVHVRSRAYTCTARTTRRDFSAYQTVVSNFPPVRRFPACAGPGRPKKNCQSLPPSRRRD